MIKGKNISRYLEPGQSIKGEIARVRGLLDGEDSAILRQVVSKNPREFDRNYSALTELLEEAIANGDTTARNRYEALQKKMLTAQYPSMFGANPGHLKTIARTKISSQARPTTRIHRVNEFGGWDVVDAYEAKMKPLWDQLPKSATLEAKDEVRAAGNRLISQQVATDLKLGGEDVYDLTEGQLRGLMKGRSLMKERHKFVGSILSGMKKGEELFSMVQEDVRFDPLSAIQDVEPSFVRTPAEVPEVGPLEQRVKRLAGEIFTELEKVRLEIGRDPSKSLLDVIDELDDRIAGISGRYSDLKEEDVAEQVKQMVYHALLGGDPSRVPHEMDSATFERLLGDPHAKGETLDSAVMRAFAKDPREVEEFMLEAKFIDDPTTRRAISVVSEYQMNLYQATKNKDARAQAYWTKMISEARRRMVPMVMQGEPGIGREGAISIVDRMTKNFQAQFARNSQQATLNTLRINADIVLGGLRLQPRPGSRSGGEVIPRYLIGRPVTALQAHMGTYGQQTFTVGLGVDWAPMEGVRVDREVLRQRLHARASVLRKQKIESMGRFIDRLDSTPETRAKASDIVDDLSSALDKTVKRAARDAAASVNKQYKPKRIVSPALEGPPEPSQLVEKILRWQETRTWKANQRAGKSNLLLSVRRWQRKRRPQTPKPKKVPKAKSVRYQPMAPDDADKIIDDVLKEFGFFDSVVTKTETVSKPVTVQKKWGSLDKLDQIIEETDVAEDVREYIKGRIRFDSATGRYTSDINSADVEEISRMLTQKQVVIRAGQYTTTTQVDTRQGLMYISNLADRQIELRDSSTVRREVVRRAVGPTGAEELFDNEPFESRVLPKRVKELSHRYLSPLGEVGEERRALRNRAMTKIARYLDSKQGVSVSETTKQEIFAGILQELTKNEIETLEQSVFDKRMDEILNKIIEVDGYRITKAKSPAERLHILSQAIGENSVIGSTNFLGKGAQPASAVVKARRGTLMAAVSNTLANFDFTDKELERLIRGAKDKEIQILRDAMRTGPHKREATRFAGALVGNMPADYRASFAGSLSDIMDDLIALAGEGAKVQGGEVSLSLDALGKAIVEGRELAEKEGDALTPDIRRSLLAEAIGDAGFSPEDARSISMMVDEDNIEALADITGENGERLRLLLRQGSAKNISNALTAVIKAEGGTGLLEVLDNSAKMAQLEDSIIASDNIASKTMEAMYTRMLLADTPAERAAIAKSVGPAIMIPGLDPTRTKFEIQKLYEVTQDGDIAPSKVGLRGTDEYYLLASGVDDGSGNPVTYAFKPEYKGKTAERVGMKAVSQQEAAKLSRIVVGMRGSDLSGNYEIMRSAEAMNETLKRAGFSEKQVERAAKAIWRDIPHGATSRDVVAGIASVINRAEADDISSLMVPEFVMIGGRENFIPAAERGATQAEKLDPFRVLTTILADLRADETVDLGNADSVRKAIFQRLGQDGLDTTSIAGMKISAAIEQSSELAGMAHDAQRAARQAKTAASLDPLKKLEELKDVMKASPGLSRLAVGGAAIAALAAAHRLMETRGEANTRQMLEMAHPGSEGIARVSLNDSGYTGTIPQERITPYAAGETSRISFPGARANFSVHDNVEGTPTNKVDGMMRSLE